METLPVTLIVKAPNQQIEDQTVKCELSWTIQKLKQHLSEVYPSKPPKHEQKLIYSGQLLNDSVMLKDILRQYEGQETHTVHLVCTAKYTNYQKSPTSQATATDRTPNTENNTTTTATEAQVPNNTTDQGLPNIQPTPPWDINGPHMTAMDANQYAMQLAWMQRAYLQYMTQYMQLAANSYGTGTPLITSVPNGDPAAQAQPQPNPAEQPAQPEMAQAPVDPDHPERDWLDIFYMFTRLIVLFSVVYFYSNPYRFVFIFILCVGLYLYQNGVFRIINNNNINNNNNGPPDPVPEEEQAPSRLMIVWTFFATFFASLIPEIPNAI